MGVVSIVSENGEGREEKMGGEGRAEVKVDADDVQEEIGDVGKREGSEQEFRQGEGGPRRRVQVQEGRGTYAPSACRPSRQ
jgi:hypothetical protein